MRQDDEKFEETGAQVLLVTQGTPEQADQFCRDRHSPFPCFADPEREAYHAFTLERGTFNQVLGPAVVLRGISAALRGFHTSRSVGDVMQMPGTFVIDRQGTVRFAHYNRDAADNPPNELLFEVLAQVD
ncbi:MAG: redoxin domain-containing protein [Chloroflexi bacterium]|nr:redoxin domain-containing protein [Chloroflexota bacterium]